MPELELSRRDLLADGTARLREANIGEPRREAVILWTELTGEDAAELILHPDRPADAALAAGFHRAVERRSCGEPLAHVIGHVGFRRLTLRSDRRALIPRPETEGLVDLLLSRVSTGKVADVGTGSGCVALSLATEGSYTHVVGLDLSAEALDLARENRRLAGARLELVRGDLCAPLRNREFDALVSNPPYLTTAEYAGLDGAVRRWEPALALESGVDGLDATSRLLDEGRAVLRHGGWLAVEIDCTRAAEIARRAAGLGWSDVAIHADLFGRERYLLARRNW